MHRRRRFGLLGGLALVVGVLVAGCSQLPFGQPAGPSLGILSRAQISFSTISFTGVNNDTWTTLIPSASGVAKGLGSGDWTVWLTADWDLVYGCMNNGSNFPNGVFNYSLSSGLGFDSWATTSHNGKSDFAIAKNTDLFQQAFDNLSPPPDVSALCPNHQNYSLQPLGARWNKIHINLYSGAYDSYDQVKDLEPTDSVTYVCSDPANPSAQTCTIQ